MKLPIKAIGSVRDDEKGILDLRLHYIEKSNKKKNEYKIDRGIIVIHLVDDEPLEDIPTAWLKLYLLSLRHYKPNELNFENIFSVLPNLIWDHKGFGWRVENYLEEKYRSWIDGLYVEDPNFDEEDYIKNFKKSDGLVGNEFDHIKSIDKFPPMTNHVIPSDVRIADVSRVRLGAYLGKGTTVMHEGFVNYNAGTEGPNMIEGRISAGVFIGKDSDLGGGCSTMGTLSGGNKEVIKVGERCLLGANSGIGISLGNDCIVEAGLYLTAGTKVTVLENNKVLKALELSGKNGILYFRDSLSGKVCARPNKGNFKLNEVLHDNN
tara:strand:+ start:34 stop:996 length:963 start_codon:yes stop_codon:yes gene_type:complete